MSHTTEFRLPELADVVESVRLGVWLKQEGDRVESGEPIAEVETDKTNVELESPVTGIVHAIKVEAGTDGLEPGAVLALITDEIAADGSLPESRTHAGEVNEASSLKGVSGQEGAERVLPPADPGSAPVTPAVAEGQAVQATPLARRMAAAAGLDIAVVRPAGSGGRIGKSDVDRVLREQRDRPPGHDQALRPAVSLSLDVADGPSAIQELTPMRRVTAKRMQHAKQTVPHFYLRTECVADAALALIASAKKLEGDEAPTLTDVVLRATAFALRKIPLANSAWDDQGVRVYDRVDIAVAVNTSQGLVTPVVRAADEKDLGAIARETRALATKAREGLLTPADYSGATFTISNLGMYGVESLYAIVNPPQSCILGVGAAVERPVVAGREVRIGTVMACTLSADHRAIDGVVGAELLAVLKAHIEQPGLMLL